ncbi:unnamed protein product, partial [Staurois parvus]
LFKTVITSLAVFPSVARGNISVPKAVTPSYTREYHAALLRHVFFTYLTLRSHDVSPAASPAISSGRCQHPASVSCPCDVGTLRAPPAAGNLKILKNFFFFFFSFYTVKHCCFNLFHIH